MDSIKLVIWDLDETFWNGTLSEEGVHVIAENVNLVKLLTKRGIINSIVSKNNFADAKSKLQEIGVWEYFIFPTIAWEGKGKLVKSVIEKCQLRPINVLFLDDNHLNLEEAKFYNNGLHVEAPFFISEIRNHHAFKGKDDASHSRLNHYKILERKYVDKSEMHNNEEFLNASGICIQYIHNLSDHTERLHELLNRTNQLNYTKKRLEPDEVENLIVDGNLDNKLIKVTDNYGDYGIVGFYSFDLKTNSLQHFVFSCRIINLGIEQFVYAILGFPNINIVPEVAIQLTSSKPDWVSVIDGTSLKLEASDIEKSDYKILFKGECNLFQMLYYLNDYSCTVIKESNYNGENNFVVNREHTQMLIDSKVLPQKQMDYLVEKIPFIDKKSYCSRVFTEEYDILVYSLLMDIVQEVYEHKKIDLKIPFGNNNRNLTDQNTWDALIKYYKKSNCEGFDLEFLKDFSKEFKHKGKISIKDFKRNLSFIRNNIPMHIPIVFLNSSEVNFSAEWESYSVNRSIEMNLALDEFIEHTPNCFLVDIRKYVKKSTEVTYGMNRYKRHTYKQLAQDLIEILQNINTVKIKKKWIALTPFIDFLRPLYRSIRSAFLGMKRSDRIKYNKGE